MELCRIAVVGLGGWGPNLLRNAAEAPGAQVVALCDVDQRRLDAVAAQHPQARREADFESVLAAPDVDAVILATPAALHAEQTRRALEAGKHVLVEKPLALTMTEGEALAALARERGRTLLVGHTFLYNGAVREMQRLVRSGELGRLYFVNAERLSLGKVRDDVNAWWNLAPHDVSILLSLFDENPVRISARGGTFLPGSRQEDVVITTLEFPSGALANITVSWLNPLKVRRMTLVGEKKMLVYDDTSADRMLVLYDQGVQSEPAERDVTGDFQTFRRTLRRGAEQVVPVDFREPLAVEIEHFLHCIRTGEEPISGAAEALRTLRVLEAAHKTLRQKNACDGRL